MQLYPAGAYAYKSLRNGCDSIAPSSVYSKYSKETPREMSIEDIHTLYEAFIIGAERAKEAGFDGVELLGSAGYLITQFLSPLKNPEQMNTEDHLETGHGSPRTYRKNAETLGPDFPITIRWQGTTLFREQYNSEVPLLLKS
jgi:2,4-dienoyl-CoA reductase (NADPH2)